MTKETIKRSELIEVLNFIKPAISTQNFIPVMSCVCFTEDDIFAYNDIICITFPNENVDFEGAIPGDLLIKLLNSYNSDDVKINIKGNTATVTSKKSRAKLAFIPVDDFAWAGLPKKKESLYSFIIDNDFIKGINKCQLSISNDAMHPEHSGIYLTGSEKAVYLHSTDNHTVSEYKVKTPVAPKNNIYNFEPIILSEPFCKAVIKVFPEMKKPVIYFNKKCVWLSCSTTGISVFGVLLSTGEGTDFSAILKKYKKDFRRDFHSLKETGITAAFQRASLINGSDQDKCTVLSIKRNELNMITETETASTVDDIKLKKSNHETPFSVSVSTDLVLRACSYATEVYFKKDVVLFKEQSFLHLIAPRN